MDGDRPGILQFVPDLLMDSPIVASRITERQPCTFVRNAIDQVSVLDVDGISSTFVVAIFTDLDALDSPRGRWPRRRPGGAPCIPQALPKQADAYQVKGDAEDREATDDHVSTSRHGFSP